MGLNLSFLVIIITFAVSFLIFVQFTNVQESIQKNTRLLEFLSYQKPQTKTEQAPPPAPQATQPVPDYSIPDKYKDMRKKALIEAAGNRANLIKIAASPNHTIFYDAVKLEAHCPEMTRVGGSGDGGKFVCNPAKAKKDCTHLSLGLNNQIQYDIAIQNITNSQKCKILGVDSNEQNPNTKKIYESIRGTAFVGMVPKTITIAQMMEKAGSKEVDLMKIDIEGGEHTGLEPFLKEYHVCQIFLEVHGTPGEHLDMMKKIARLGFRLFSIEPNIYCKSCCEYSYINELCMQQFGVIPLANNVPLD